MNKNRKNFTDRLKLVMPDGLSQRLTAEDGFEIHYGGHKVKFEQLKDDTENGVLRFKETNGGLHVECSMHLQPDYSAARWELRLTNQGELPTEPIDRLSLLSLAFEGSGVRWCVITANGGTTENFYPPLAYRTEERIIHGGCIEIESHQRGRSSNKNIPLMVAAYGENEQAPGFFCGLEWSANWFIRLIANEDGALIEAGPKTEGLILEPGETLSGCPYGIFLKAGLALARTPYGNISMNVLPPGMRAIRCSPRSVMTTGLVLVAGSTNHYCAGRRTGPQRLVLSFSLWMPPGSREIFPMV